MQEKVQIKPELLRWARDRAALPIEKLRKDFPKIEAWEAGEDSPTLKQLEDFAKKTHAPIGYLFLDNPPEEPMPIQDFRTLGSHAQRRLSVNARDMIYICQRRQAWYHNYAIANGIDKADFVGGKNCGSEPAAAAAEMRAVLQISLDEQFKLAADSFLSALIKQVETAGILVMRSGIVGSNGHRALDLAEFRGFALTDDYAPLIFINSRDNAAGNIFTLAHELGHLCLGQTGISDTALHSPAEKWCNAFAAEFLVPLSEFQQRFNAGKTTDDNLAELSKRFNVSRLVILLRMKDSAYITPSEFSVLWNRENGLINTAAAKKKAGGGDYYKTLPVRVSRRFLQALYSDTLEGNTLYRDALRMAGVKTTETFMQAAQRVK